MRRHRPRPVPASRRPTRLLQRLLPRSRSMSSELPEGALPIGTRVTFPYGGSRRTGTISDVSAMPDPNGGGGSSVAYLIDVGSRKVFVQGGGVVPAGEGPPQGF